jgi:hypothetical protein
MAVVDLICAGLLLLLVYALFSELVLLLRFFSAGLSSSSQQALERLGRLEEGNVSEAFSQMSGRSAELVAARRKGCEALAARFEAPLKESVSWHS